jgi:hypothetical protein
MKARLDKILSIISLALLSHACSTAESRPVVAQKPFEESLVETISHLDSGMFNAFNSRDFEAFQRYLSPELEIYQDNIGLRNYRQSMEAFQKLLTGEYVLARQLVKGSLEVYPIKDYGAIEIGRHTFCHIENGRQDCGTYRFVHIWKHENGDWKITRIITYDHKQ